MTASLFHTDCGTEIEDLYCPKCNLYPDAQSTEFRSDGTEFSIGAHHRVASMSGEGSVTVRPTMAGSDRRVAELDARLKRVTAGQGCWNCGCPAEYVRTGSLAAARAEAKAERDAELREALTLHPIQLAEKIEHLIGSSNGSIGQVTGEIIRVFQEWAALLPAIAKRKS